MEAINELATALAKAQSKMEGAAKDTSNPFFKSKYADLASVTGAVRSGLDGTGLSYVQLVHDKPDCAAIETLILHSSGQSLSTGIVCVPVAKHDAQGYGSAITYARRYGLAMAFGVAPEDDDGNAAQKAKPVTPPKPAPAASVPKQDFDALPMGKQVTLREASELPLEQCEAGDYASAYATIESLNLDSDDKVAFWSLFASQHRSALKRVSEQQNKKAA